MATKLPTVAIIGRANAGKSSLFNRIMRAQQAIVAREAGTTRDNVIGKARHGQHTFWLVDTAGLKPAEDEFEATIQEQIAEAADAADVILVAADSTEYPNDEDRRVAKTALKSRKPVILLLNKTDLRGSLPDGEFRRLGIKTIIHTSAEHNTGIHELLDAVCAEIPIVHDKPASDIVKVALIGRPNVGKSSLFNTLAGKQQAIVANVAGTTRDLGRITLGYHGHKIELIDTAGIRRQGKQAVGIEKFSVLRSLQAIEEADICFLLMDVNELNTQLDQRLAGLINDAGKGLVLVVSKWDAAIGKDAYTRDALAPRIANTFDFVPWAPLIFTSSTTGQNVTKLFDLALDIQARRQQPTKTRVLNDMLQRAIQAHPPAGLKNSHPKLRYIVHTDTNPPWFVVYGSNLKFVHWSYKRYLERQLRDAYNYTGTPIKLSFRDEKQIKSNRERVAKGLEPVTKAYKQAKETEELGMKSKKRNR